MLLSFSYDLGVQRVAPSSLVRKQKTLSKRDENDGSLELSDVDDNDESFEMVDKFRFNIDADSLRAAILKKSKLKGRQQLSLTQSDQSSTIDEQSEEITFNQSLLDKLASGEAVIDDSGENTIIRLVLDHDDFAAMVDSNSNDYPLGADDEDDGAEDELMYSSEAVYVDKKERAERKKSMVYSEVKMREAERFINREIRSESSKENIFNREEFLEGYRNKDDIKNSNSHNENKEGMNTEDINILRIKRMKIEKEIQKNKPKPRQYLADMSRSILLENIYGTAVIGFSLAATIFLFDTLSILFLSVTKSISKIVLDFFSISYSKRIHWQRSAKPLLLISIVICRTFIHLLNRIRNFNRFAGIGYREGQTVKQSSGFFRSKFDDAVSFVKNINNKKS